MCECIMIRAKGVNIVCCFMSTISYRHGHITEISSVGAVKRDLVFRWKKISSVDTEGFFQSSLLDSQRIYSMYYDASLTSG